MGLAEQVPARDRDARSSRVPAPDSDGVRPEDERWSGNHAGLAELNRAGIRAILAERNPIERNLQRDAVLLFGTSLQELSSK